MSTIESTEALSETKAAPILSEDWLSVAIGLAVFALAFASLAGPDDLHDQREEGRETPRRRSPWA